MTTSTASKLSMPRSFIKWASNVTWRVKWQAWAKGIYIIYIITCLQSFTDIMSTGFAQPAYHSHFNLANVGSCSALKITSKLYSLLKCQRFEMDHFMRPQNRLHSHTSPPPTRLLLATRFSLHSFKGHCIHPLWPCTTLKAYTLWLGVKYSNIPCFVCAYVPSVA